MTIKTRTMQKHRHLVMAQRRLVWTLVAWFTFSGTALAGPQGGNVVGGDGAISAQGLETRIDQSSSRLAVEWDSFNVATNESVQFNQPDAGSVALNSILDHNPSQIFGAINANGQVFLVNPNGMVFGASARLNVAGLLATTASVGTEDFMAGKYDFATKDGQGGLIHNQGVIEAADGGYVVMLGDAVLNEGAILAELGSIDLAAGRSATLDFSGGGLLLFEVGDEVTENITATDDAVKNTGELIADGGRILMSAAAAHDVYTRAVNNEGLARASRIDDSGGVIRLIGSGDVYSSGTLDASGGEGAGGTVQVLGDRVALHGDATIDVSGDAGGGLVQVGGAFQGSDPDVQNATDTYVGSGVAINADADVNGDGGEVIVWADGTTRYYGDISSRGGSAAGDGGFVEVSGKQNLDFHGGVDLTASNGTGGRLLLDPENIILDNTVQAPPTDEVDGIPDIAWDDPPDPGTTTVEIADVVGFSELYLQATNDINVNEVLTMDPNGSLLLEAGNDIGVNANVAVSGTGTITLTADADFTATGGAASDGAGEITGVGTLTQAAGTMTLSAGDGITLSGLITAPSIAMTVTAGDIGALGAEVDVAGVSDLTLDAAGSIYVDGDGATNLTDLTLVVDPSTNADSTYALNTFLNLTAFSVADNVANIELGTTTLTGPANFSLTSTTGNILDATSAVTATGIALAATAGDVGAAGTEINVAGVTDLSIEAAGSFHVDGGGVALTDLAIAVDPSTATDSLYVLSNFTGVTLGLADNGADVELGPTTITPNFDLTTASGDINQTDVVSITGTSTFTADAGAINLTNAGNDFTGAVSLNTTGANAASVTDTNAIVLGTSSVGTGLLTVNAVGITQAGGSSITTGGDATFNGGAAAIDLTNPANDFTGAVSLNTTGAANNASVTDADGLDLGTSAVGGNLVAVATLGNISNTGGALDVDGTASFTADAAGADIVVGNLANDFTGAVTFAGAGGLNDVTIADVSALQLQAGLTVGGNLDVTAAGISQAAGGITVTGTSDFDAGGNAITLTDGANDFTAAVSLNTTGAANNASVTDADGLDLGTSAVGGNLVAVATLGNISNTGGVLDVDGTASFTADAAGADIVVGNLANDFTGAVTFAGAGGLNDVTIADVSALQLQAGLTVGGNLDVTAAGISQAAGGITVTGTSDFDAGGNAITLTDGANDFTAAVSLNTTGAANNASVTDADGLDLGTSAVGGNLVAVATLGNISNTGGALDVDGTASFTADAAGADIVVGNLANDFTGAVTFAGAGGLNDVTIADVSALQLQAGLTVGGNLDVTAAGISQAAGGITVTGTSDFDAGGNAITLTDGANDFTAAVSLNNSGLNAVAVTDANAIELGTSSVGTSTLTVNGVGITQTGTITQAAAAGAATFNGGAGAITLTAANDFTGAVSLNTTGAANNASVTDADGLDLGTSAVGGNLVAVATLGNISNTGGALDVDGTASFTADAAGADIVVGNLANDFTGAVTFAGAGGLNDVTIADVSALQLQAGLTVGGNLDVTAAGISQAAGGITVTGTSDFDAGGNAITLTDGANDFTAAVSLNTTGAANNASVTDADGLDLGTSAVGGNLVAVATLGNISNTGGVLDVDGTASFTADAAGADIVVGNLANDFTGAVTFAGAGGLNDVTIADVSALQLQAGLTVGGNLDVTAAGISQAAGGITVTGTSDFDAGGNAITLTDGANDFTGAVSLNNSGLNAVAVTDANAIELGTSSVGTSTLTVNGVGITQTGTITQAAAAGAATFNGGAGAITLTAANDFTGAVSLNNSGLNAVAVTDANAIELGTSSVGTSTLTVNGVGITQTGTITQAAAAGAATFNGGAAAIDLTAANDFTGAVSLNNSGLNAVAVTDANAIELGTSSVGTSTLTVNGVGITQTGTITQAAAAGAATFNGGAAAIDLTAANDFTGAVSLNTTGAANNASVTDADGLDLGTSAVGGNLVAVATLGNISNTGGALDVDGTASFTADAAGADIVVGNLANDFTGAVTFAGAGGLNDVTIADVSALQLQAGLTVGGNLDVTAAGISQAAGGITVTGTSDFDAGGNAITLTDGANDFTAAVSLNTTGAANNASVTDADGLDLGTSAVGGNLVAVATLGNISNTGGALDVDGTASFTADAAGADIVVGNLANDFTGAVTFAGAGGLNDVTIADVSALQLQAGLTVGGNLDVTAAGISQAAGGITVTGTSDFDAGGNAITLTDAANDFGGAVLLTNSGANAVSVTDTDDIVLGIASVGTGLLTVNAVGISQAAGGGIFTGGAATFNGGAAAIDLTNAANNFAGAVSLNNSGANDAAVTDAAGLNLGASTVGGDLAATATTGNVSNTGALAVTGASTFTADAAGANIAVDNAGNALTGAVTFAGAGGLNDVTVVDTTALQLQSGLTVGGNLDVTAAGISQAAGGITVTGTSDFDAGGNAITLTDAANDFGGAVLLTNSGANAVSVTDTDDIVLGIASVGTGLLTVNAVGISQAAGGGIFTGGAATFNGGAAAIDLTNANDFGGAVSLNNSGANAVAVTDINAIVLGTSGVGSDTLTVNAVGITQSGAITQAAGAGAATFNGGAGAIALNSANDFTGAVSLNNSGANAVSVTDANAIELGASLVGTGLLTVNAVGITQTGAITTGGAATFNGGAAAIDLTNAGNDFAGAVSLNNSGANDASVTDADGLDLGASTVGGALAATATAGDISNSGTLTVAGTSTFTADAAGANIAVDNASNALTGAVTFAGAGGLNDVTVVDTTALELQSGLAVGGNLDVTAAGITQAAGGITVTGTSAFDAGAAAIDLTDAANDFTGAVSLTNSGANAVSVTDANAIVLGTSSVGTGLLTVNAVGITQTGAITTGGAATFNGGAAAIDLTNAGNDFAGAVSLNNSGANAVTVTDANAIELGTSSVGTSTLTVNAVGITQSGAITQAAGAGAATFNGGAGAIALNSANDFTGAVSLNTTSDASVTDADELILGDSTVSGDLAATATTGSISNTGTLTVGGTSTFTANGAGGSVDLDMLALTGALTADTSGSGGDVSIASTSALTVGQIMAGSGEVSLDVGSDLTIGTITNTNGDIVIDVEDGPLLIGMLTTDGDFFLTATGGDALIGATGLGEAILTGSDTSQALLTTTGTIGAGENGPIGFVGFAKQALPNGELPIILEFNLFASVVTNGSPVENVLGGTVSDPGAEAIAAGVQADAANREDSTDIDWAAYSEEIELYAINVDGVQLPEDQRLDEFSQLRRELELKRREEEVQTVDAGGED